MPCQDETIAKILYIVDFKQLVNESKYLRSFEKKAQFA